MSTFPPIDGPGCNWETIVALAQAQLVRISSGLCAHDVSPLATRFA